MRIPVADDVTLAADAFGDPDDPPVVLLHGGGQTRHAWGNTARQLGAGGWYALTVDLRGHGDSDWSPDGVYSLERFAGDVRRIAASLPRRPALVGASLGGIASLLAIGESRRCRSPSALVLVDVAPRIEPAAPPASGTFMRQGLDGFPDLEAAADAIASYNPHRPRPKDLSGLTKNLRQRDDGRWYWHWDPRFMAPEEPPDGGIDGVPTARMVPQERLEAAARQRHRADAARAGPGQRPAQRGGRRAPAAAHPPRPAGRRRRCRAHGRRRPQRPLQRRRDRVPRRPTVASTREQADPRRTLEEPLEPPGSSTVRIPSCRRAPTSATWPSWPTSTTARPPSSTRCSGSPARSAPTRTSTSG